MKNILNYLRTMLMVLFALLTLNACDKDEPVTDDGNGNTQPSVTPTDSVPQNVTPTDTTPSNNGNTSISVTGKVGDYSYVDLGLPSGTLWATCNIGATKPEEYGDEFKWGETVANSDYKYDGKGVRIIDYVRDEMIIDGEYNSWAFPDGHLLPEYDAATANWGEEWRMPSLIDAEELKRNCTVESAIVNEVDGTIVTGSNGNTIFFPKLPYNSNWLASHAKLYTSVHNFGGLTLNSGYGYENASHPVRPILCKNNKGFDKYNEKSCESGTKGGHSYVDLGLPSGTLWATMNIGAKRHSDYGNCYAWGETETKESYNSQNYKIEQMWWRRELLEKNGIVDGVRDNSVSGSLGHLTANYDAATVNWGKDWRMPSADDFTELKENCKTEWTSQNGIIGVKFIANNGNWIFLPYAGEFEENYWSSSVSGESNFDDKRYNNPFRLIITAGSHSLGSSWYDISINEDRRPDGGYLIRPVTK